MAYFNSPKFNTPVSSRPGTPFTECTMLGTRTSRVSSPKEISSKPTEIYYVSPYYQIVEKITLPVTAPPSYVDLATDHKHFLNDELEQPKPKHGVAA